MSEATGVQASLVAAKGPAAILEFMQKNLGALPSEGPSLIGQLTGLHEQQKALITETGRLRDQRTMLSNQLGDLELDRYELPAAQAHYEGARALYQELADRSGIAQSFYNLAQVAFRQENVDTADAEHSQSFGRRHKRIAVHFEQVISLSDLNSRSTEWSPEFGIPVLACVDLLEAITSVLDNEVGSK